MRRPKARTYVHASSLEAAADLSPEVITRREKGGVSGAPGTGNFGPGVIPSYWPHAPGRPPEWERPRAPLDVLHRRRTCERGAETRETNEISHLFP